MSLDKKCRTSKQCAYDIDNDKDIQELKRPLESGYSKFAKIKICTRSKSKDAHVELAWAFTRMMQR